jgi:hypothetical protein
VVGGGFFSAEPLASTFTLHPYIKLTRGDDAVAGGAAPATNTILRTSGVDAGDYGADSAKKDWLGYSTSLTRGLGNGFDKVLTSNWGLSEVSSTFPTPNACYDWSTELELGSFNDDSFNDMTLSQDSTHFSHPQFVNNPALDMTSNVPESQLCGPLPSYNATAHTFERTAAISQGFKSLESITDRINSYERRSPSEPLTGLTRLSDSFQYPLCASTNLALSPLPSAAPPQLELPPANGKQ